MNNSMGSRGLTFGIYEDVVESPGTRLTVVPTVAEHVHEWAWLRTGRVPGESLRWMEYDCICGEGKRVDR